MTSLTEFFNKHEDDTLKGISHKNSIIKRNIIAHMAVNGECTLSELTKELHISVPTITKLVQELVDENIVTDLGKVETPGGRRPNIFGLANSAIYFAGVNVGRDNMTFLITDLQNNIIKEEYDYTFELLDRPQCIERICTNIENFIATCGIDRGKILGLGVCMTGRVNPDTGRSYKYFTTSEQSLRDMIEERGGIRPDNRHGRSLRGAQGGAHAPRRVGGRACLCCILQRDARGHGGESPAHDGGFSGGLRRRRDKSRALRRSVPESHRRIRRSGRSLKKRNALLHPSGFIKRTDA